MSIDPETLIDRIYEASLVPELWRAAIDAVCAVSASVSGSILCVSERDHTIRGIASEFSDAAFQQFMSDPGCWDSPRIRRGLAPDSPMAIGFARFEDLLSAREIKDDLVESIQRRIGIGFQVSTLVRLPSSDVAAFTFERWRPNGRHPTADLARLDALRPHLARAAVVSARLGLERARSMVASLEAAGLPAAALSADGRALAVNPAFERASDLLLPGAFGKIVIAAPAAQALFEKAIEEAQRAAAPVVRSIPVAVGTHRATPAVLHLVPVRGAAHDVFSGAALLLIATSFGTGAALPDMPLLHGLFDLTPREAQLCAALATGHSLKAAAATLGMNFSTARAHLEHIFSKTGTHRQAELVLLLQSAQPIAAPVAPT